MIGTKDYMIGVGGKTKNAKNKPTVKMSRMFFRSKVTRNACMFLLFMFLLVALFLFIWVNYTLCRTDVFFTKTLNDMLYIFKKNEVEGIFISYGALLGLIRDGQLLQHDYDIEFILKNDDRTWILNANVQKDFEDMGYITNIEEDENEPLFLTLYSPEPMWYRHLHNILIFFTQDSRALKLKVEFYGFDYKSDGQLELYGKRGLLPIRYNPQTKAKRAKLTIEDEDEEEELAIKSKHSHVTEDNIMKTLGTDILCGSFNEHCFEEEYIYPLKKLSRTRYDYKSIPFDIYVPHDPEYFLLNEYGDDWGTKKVKGWKKFVCMT